MRKLFCLTLCLLLVTAMCTAVSAQEVETITAISFPNDNAVAEENLSVSGYGDKDSGYATSTVGGRIYASVSGTDLRKLEWSKGEYADVGSQPVMTGGTKNPWGSGAYLEIRVPTTGYENITFSASIGATKKGPRDYKLQYSTDGVSFTDVAGAFFTVTANKTMFKAFDNAALPAAANNSAMLYIRITVASTMMVNGTAGLIGSAGGETAINHVVVRGTPIAVSTTATTTTAPDIENPIPTTSTTTTAATVHPTVSNAPVPASTTTTDTTTTAFESVKTGENTNSAWTALLVLLITAGGILSLKRIKV